MLAEQMMEDRPGTDDDNRFWCELVARSDKDEELTDLIWRINTRWFRVRITPSRSYPWYLV